MKPQEFNALGKNVRTPCRQLEVFPKPAGVEKVVLESDEVTSLCPVTGQPDWETVTITFAPDKTCLESKSLKLYLWSYRDQGVFCEALAGQIAQDVFEACRPHWCTVTVTQKPRGGIKITATATVGVANTGTEEINPK
ncbi:MAG TPA: preQ(1) synthase [Bacillota bacterium]|nr:preQ(1) synthase [Bacillota bacterium]